MPVKPAKTNNNKKMFLKALVQSLGIVSEASRKTGFSRTQFYKWCQDDPKYKKEVEDIDNDVLDMVESSLHRQIKNDNATSTIFFLKMKGRGRGYIEKSEIDLKVDRSLDLSKLSDDDLNKFIELSDKAKADE